MYDTIESEQYKCFGCNLDHYKIGDKVPCKEHGYNENIIIIPFGTHVDDYWQQKDFVIIKNSMVLACKTISELDSEDFKEINHCIDYMGQGINTKAYDELLDYIKDLKIMGVNEEIEKLEHKDEFYDSNFYELLKEKWYIK